MTGTKEFYDLMDMFEKQIKYLPGHSHKLDKADTSKCPKDIFYDDGTTNELFHAFMHGYSFAKSIFKEQEGAK